MHLQHVHCLLTIPSLHASSMEPPLLIVFPICCKSVEKWVGGKKTTPNGQDAIQNGPKNTCQFKVC